MEWENHNSHFYYIFKHLTHSLPCSINWWMLIFLENVSSLNIPLCPAKYALLLYMMKVSQITLSFLPNPHGSEHFLYAPWSAYAVSLLCTKIHLAKVFFFLMKMSSFRFQCAFLGWLSQMDLILLADCTLFLIFLCRHRLKINFRQIFLTDFSIPTKEVRGGKVKQSSIFPAVLLIIGDISLIIGVIDI